MSKRQKVIGLEVVTRSICQELKVLQVEKDILLLHLHTRSITNQLAEVDGMLSFFNLKIILI